MPATPGVFGIPASDVRAGGRVGVKLAGGRVGGSPRKIGALLAGMRDQKAVQGSGHPGGGWKPPGLAAGCAPGQVFGVADDGGTNQSSGPSSKPAPGTSGTGLPGGGL